MTAGAETNGRGPRPQGAARGEAPLVAVCGLAGGAGTTTIAELLARWAAERARRGVLLCDTGGPAAALAAHTGERSRLALPFASVAIARGGVPRGLFVSLTERLRMIAAAPDDGDAFDPGGLAELLAQARAAHELTVIDCGTLQREVERATARLASHCVWVTRASAADARRARLALAALASLARGAELLLARAGSEPAAIAKLMRLAEERRVPLVLVPGLDGAGRGDADLERLRAPLEAIGSALR